MFAREDGRFVAEAPPADYDEDEDEEATTTSGTFDPTPYVDGDVDELVSRETRAGGTTLERRVVRRVDGGHGGGSAADVPYVLVLRVTSGQANDDEARRGLVMHMHSTGSSKEAVIERLCEWARAGYDAASFDAPGHGERAAKGFPLHHVFTGCAPAELTSAHGTPCNAVAGFIQATEWAAEATGFRQFVFFRHEHVIHDDFTGWRRPQ